MAHIRIKKISDIPYAYLVKNIRTNKGPRQKVVKYLGRVHYLDKKENSQPFQVQDRLLQLILNTLAEVGFVEKNQIFVRDNFIFDPVKYSITNKKGKESIISINEGHICTFTLQRLKEFQKSDNIGKDAPTLAKYFLEAGIMITETDFVQFYQNLIKISTKVT